MASYCEDLHITPQKNNRKEKSGISHHIKKIPVRGKETPKNDKKYFCSLAVINNFAVKKNVNNK